MSGQLPMQFWTDALGAQIWKRTLAATNDYVDKETLKEVAYRLNRKPASLCDALSESNRKDLKAEELVGMMAMPGGDVIFRELAQALGYDITRIKPLDPVEHLTGLEQLVIDRLGLAGKAAVDEMRKRASLGKKLDEHLAPMVEERPDMERRR